MKKSNCEALLTSLNHVVEQMPEGLARLTPEDRQLMLSPRVRFEAFAEQIAEAAENAGVDLPKRPLSAMHAAIATATEAARIEEVLDVMHKRAQDTVTKHRVVAYRIFLAYYRALQAIAVDDAEIADAIAPAAELFAAKAKPKDKPMDAPPANEDGEPTVVTPAKVPA